MSASLCILISSYTSVYVLRYLDMHPSPCVTWCHCRAALHRFMYDMRFHTLRGGGWSDGKLSNWVGMFQNEWMSRGTVHDSLLPANTLWFSFLFGWTRLQRVGCLWVAS